MLSHKQMEEPGFPEASERDLAALEFLKQQLASLYFSDHYSKAKHEFMLTEQQVKILWGEFDEAVRDTKRGIPLSLTGKDVKYFEAKINGFKQALIENNIISKDKTF